jgi:Nucleoside-diphosphate-sugar epimerases
MLILDVDAPAPRRKVAVFGGDGFLGSHFVEQLLLQGHEVTVFGHTRHGAVGNLSGVEGRFRRVLGEFSDSGAVAAALRGQDIAAHFILSSTPVDSWGQPLRTIETDLQPSVRFFELAAEAGVRKIIFASSGGTLYGPHDGPADESEAPHPFSPHGIVKLCAEHFLTYFREQAGIASDSYRIGNAYGPRQVLGRSQGVVAAWIGRILDGRPLDVYGDGHTLRDYVFVRDAARLMTFSLHDINDSGTYNLGTGKGTSILELLRIFESVAGRPFEYRLHPRRASDNPSAILASDRLLRHFPDFHFQALEEGVRETFAWAVRERAGREQA